MSGGARPRAAPSHHPPRTLRGHVMPFIEAADRTALFVTAWGSGPPVVFTHAWGLRSDQWNYQVPALAAAGLRCVLYDRRGHGRSDRSATGYDMDTLADDLAADVPKWCADFEAAGPYFGSSPGGSQGLVDWTTRMIVDTPLHVLLETLKLNADADTRTELQKIQLPTLIIHGDQDASAPIGLTGRKTAELIPGASLSVYPGTGHGLYASDHDALNTDLLAFINGHRGFPSCSAREARNDQIPSFQPRRHPARHGPSACA